MNWSPGARFLIALRFSGVYFFAARAFARRMPPKTADIHERGGCDEHGAESDEQLGSGGRWRRRGAAGGTTNGNGFGVQQDLLNDLPNDLPKRLHLDLSLYTNITGSFPTSAHIRIT
jgi:hypothetical protein